MLFHQVARSLNYTLLFQDHVEARALWDRVCQASPGLVAVCLMPDHVHVYGRKNVREPLRHALGSYTQWLNHRRGTSGRLWDRLPAAVEVKEGQKAWRTERYVHLNPCRAALTEDPLRWPWSSYRDAVGLCLAPVRPASRYPLRYHGRTVNDPTAVDRGLPLFGQLDWEDEGALRAVWGAVSSLTRTPGERMWARGEPRTLFIQAAKALTERTSREIAAFGGISLRTVQRVAPRVDDRVRLVGRVAGDARFAPLQGLDHAALWRWVRRKRSRGPGPG